MLFLLRRDSIQSSKLIYHYLFLANKHFILLILNVSDSDEK